MWFWNMTLNFIISFQNIVVKSTFILKNNNKNSSLFQIIVVIFQNSVVHSKLSLEFTTISAQSRITFPQLPDFISSKPCKYSLTGNLCVITGFTSRPDLTRDTILYQVSNISRPYTPFKYRLLNTTLFQSRATGVGDIPSIA